MSDVSVVLLSYNRKDVIGKSVQRLLDLSKQTGCEVIVVDNASTDGSTKIISDNLLNSGAQFILNDMNYGVSEGRNIGWRRACRRFVLSVDDDIEVSDHAVLEMVSAMLSSDRVGAVSPDIVDSRTKRIINQHVRETKQGAAALFEACFLVSREVIDRVGYLDHRLAVAGEGLDFSYRLRKAGYIIRRISTAQVVHEDRSRANVEHADRRRRWLWSFCYVYWKNSGWLLASLKSARIVLAHARASARIFGASYVASLIPACIAGARAGRSARLK